MVLWEEAGPMPGSASSCSLVAELMSSRSALAAVAVAALADDLAAWATAIPLIRLSAKSAPRILVMNFLVMVVFSLFLLSFFVAGRLGSGFGHELSSFGLAVPAATLVVDATVGVDPDLAAGLSGGDLRIRSCGGCLGCRLLGCRHAAGRSRGGGACRSGGGALWAGAFGTVSSHAASFLLFRDFFVGAAAVVSLAAVLSAAVADLSAAALDLCAAAADLSAAAAVLSAAAAFLSAAAFSFLAFFAAFLVAAVSELVSLDVACAFAKAGGMATVSSRQKASIHRIGLLWE